MKDPAWFSEYLRTAFGMNRITRMLSVNVSQLPPGLVVADPVPASSARLRRRGLILYRANVHSYVIIDGDPFDQVSPGAIR